jgi:ribonuclease P protein component
VPTPPAVTFSKRERLCLRRHIQALTLQGQRVWRGSAFSVKAAWLLADSPEPPKVLLSVSKRIFRRAHDRNRTKRLLREVYRHHKAPLHSLTPPQPGHYLAVHLLWQGRQLPALAPLQADMATAMLKLVAQAAALPCLDPATIEPPEPRPAPKRKR